MKNLSKSFLILSTLIFFFADCKKDDLAPQSKLNINDTNFYFQALADAVPVYFRHQVNNYQSGAGAEIEQLKNQEVVLKQSMVIMNPASKQNYICVVIQKKVSKVDSKLPVVKGIIMSGKYSFGRRYDTKSGSGADGVVVYFVDSQGKEWASDAGEDNHHDNFFAITDRVENKDVSAAKYISTASFSCMLYDGNGDSLRMTNAIIRCRSERDID